MVGKWLVVLPLFVHLNKVILQPITEGNNERRARQLDLEDCCPCRDEDSGLARGLDTTLPRLDCPCQPRASDAEASASILIPALRAMQPFVKQAEQKSDPKPLLQPEVGLASSVLETLRQATDEEYQDARARDAARSAVNLIESDLSSDALTETPKNVVRIFLSPKDDMDDNLPEPSHVQETRCIHSPLESKHNMEQLRMRRPTPIIEVFNTPRKPIKKLRNKNLLHRNLYEMDSGVGASNIQEHVIPPNIDGNLEDVKLKSNPTLFNLFPKNNAASDESQKGAGQNMDGITTLRQLKPKTNFKLRNLANNLDSDEEKPTLPFIDLKKYFATTTRLPPLKLKPLEKSIFRTNKPLQLKDLLKLKDVELIPRKELTVKIPKKGTSLFSNSKLKSGISSNYENNNNNEDYKNCEDEDTNTAPSMNRDIIAIGSETIQSGESQTNLEPDFILDNNKSVVSSNNRVIQKHISDECMNSINNNMNSMSAHPIDVGNQENYDDYDTESADDGNIALIDEESNTKKTKESLNNNESNEYICDEDSVINAYQIELLEDLNYPFEFDNSSIVPELDLKDTDNTHTETLNDPIADPSDNDLQIIEQSNEQPTMSQVIVKNKPIDCSSHDQSAEYSNPVVNIHKENLLAEEESDEVDNHNDFTNHKQYSNLQNKHEAEDLNYVEESKKPNTMKLKSSQKVETHLNEDIGHVSIKDLQEMSNSLLNLSECGTIGEKSMNTKSFVTESLKEPSDYSDEIANVALSSEKTSFKDSKEITIEDIRNDKVSMISEKGENEITSLTSHENTCNPSIVNDNTKDFTKAENENFANNLDTGNSGLSAEDIKADSSSIIHTNLKLIKTSATPNNINEITNPNAISKPDIADILQGNRHSKILGNLKSKLDNLLKSPEKISDSDVFTSPEDNVNESSNMKPIITKFDESNLQQMPQILRETSLPNIPGFSLGSYKNKLAVPNSLDRTINLDPALNGRIGLLSSPSVRKDYQRKCKDPQTLRSSLENMDKFGSSLTSNSKNYLNSPIELSKPFEDTWDPSSALSDLSDRLRSHTENAIQNVKETLESRLKESQTVSFRKPSDTMDTNDILESISNRRDEFNEKLQAIHSDINDRFSTFQQSILDHISQTPSMNSDFERDTGLKSSHTPLKKISSLSEVSKPITVPNKQDRKSFLPLSVLDKSESTERLKSPKISKVSGVPRFQNSNEFTRDLDQNMKNLRSGKLFEKFNFPSTQQKLPIIPNGDRVLKKPLLSSTATVRPSLIPRLKTLKSVTDTEPKLSTESSSNVKQSKIPVLTDGYLTKNKLTLKPERMNKLSERPHNSPSHLFPSSIHHSERTFNNGRDEIFSPEEDSTTNHENTLRKAVLQRNPDIQTKNTLKIPTSRWHLPNGALKIKSGDDDGRNRSSYKTNILAKNNGNALNRSNIDISHSATQNVENVRLVEPLKENVPYKCKLICYKDS